jgi:hypothetical protein
MRHSKITDHIWCGGALSREAWAGLHELGVRIDLSLQEEARDDFGGLPPEAELWLPAADCFMPSLDQLVIATRFIHTAVSLGKRIVVHCKHGIGRAPMTVACYLITQGMTTRRAVEHVRLRRPIVEPNYGQMEAVEEFERMWATGAFDFGGGGHDGR